MTLIRRLSIATLIAAIVFFYTVKWLYPKPDYAGEYKTANARGSYILRILDRETAVMIYIEKSGTKYAYRGQLMPANGFISVSWTEQRQNDSWELLPTPINAKLKRQSPDEIATAEGTFERVPMPLWRRWFTY